MQFFPRSKPFWVVNGQLERVATDPQEGARSPQRQRAGFLRVLPFTGTPSGFRDATPDTRLISSSSCAPFRWLRRWFAAGLNFHGDQISKRGVDVSGWSATASLRDNLNIERGHPAKHGPDRTAFVVLT